VTPFQFTSRYLSHTVTIPIKMFIGSNINIHFRLDMCFNALKIMIKKPFSFGNCWTFSQIITKKQQVTPLN